MEAVKGTIDVRADLEGVHCRHERDPSGSPAIMSKQSLYGAIVTVDDYYYDSVSNLVWCIDARNRLFSLLH